MNSTILKQFKSAQATLVNKYRLNFPEVVKFRRELHKYPELSGQEHKTKEKLLAYLAHRGAVLQEVKHFANTGFTYDIRGLGPAKGKKMTIGFRSEMDALELTEQTGLTYASVYPNVAHSCGHDGHMATLIGAADILFRHRKAIPSNQAVRLVFQPAEEYGKGGEKMVKEGALIDLDEIFAYHTWNIPFGKFSISQHEPMTARTLCFSIDIQGKGSHGAYPERGNDPIVALAHTYSVVHTILSRGISRREFAVCTIGKINAGSTDNTIPDQATMSGTIRTYKKEVENEIQKLLENIVNRVPKGLGCTGKVRYLNGSNAIINAEKPSSELRSVIGELFGQDSLLEDGIKASEDFSCMTEAVPGAYMLVGNSTPGQEIINHNSAFDFNDDLLAPCILAWIKLIEKKFEISLT